MAHGSNIWEQEGRPGRTPSAAGRATPWKDVKAARKPGNMNSKQDSCGRLCVHGSCGFSGDFDQIP